jgi:hypothetical protein
VGIADGVGEMVPQAAARNDRMMRPMKTEGILMTFTTIASEWVNETP